jgi:hypothetical protein
MECDAKAQCGGVEWYESGWNGSKCHLMLTGWGAQKADHGHSGDMWQDAQCFVRDNLKTTCEAYTKYNNYCVNANNKDLGQTRWKAGDGSQENCEAECSSDIQCNGYEWYETKSVCHLMKTGWGKNKSAKGASGKRWKDAICMVKNDCNAQFRIKMKEPSQSTNTSYNVREAANALDGNDESIIHTDNEKSGWWTAKFGEEGTYKVESVKIMNRPDGWGDRLGDAVVEIDDKVCGTVQSTTKQGVWYTVTCETPIIGKTMKITSKADTPLHFAEIRAFGVANKQCTTDTCTGSQYLLKSGRCADCPTGWITDPEDKTSCIYGKMLKEIKCKRGHRVDQISTENYDSELIYSHNGHAGGSWRNKNQIVKMKGDEYVKRVDGHHITAGGAKGQLYKVVYHTNHDRIIKCFNKKIKYQTTKATFIAEEGNFIKHVNQYEDARKCCGKIIGIDEEPVKTTVEEALDS